MKKTCAHTYNDIISVENLLDAWSEFLKGKRSRKDIQEFELKLMKNIIDLHNNLADKTYEHSKYESFNVNDPKPRNIHKATVKDRLLHHAIYRKLYSFFDKTFIFDSYSCRLNKGTHKAMNRFCSFAYKVGENNTKTCWVLKCDIKKFFANIDHKILLEILKECITDKNILWLLGEVIESFDTEEKIDVGLPLGNLTSQLLVNIYMNEFDQFVKHKLKVKYYVRYADDFVFLSKNREWLENLIPVIKKFLKNKLKLELHPDKVFIKTIASGVDFLGWVHFTDHRILRTSTKRRMMKKIKANHKKETIDSYLGMLDHGNGYKLKRIISVGYPISHK